MVAIRDGRPQECEVALAGSHCLLSTEGGSPDSSQDDESMNTKLLVIYLKLLKTIEFCMK